ncbi:MAG: D-lyxose/D-mannose family sugar isomerase [Spirochaetaceae bacterium]
MKRSEINTIIERAKDFMGKHQFHLPRWAYWRPEDWKGKHEQVREIIEAQLGWDITDFGQGDFARRGLVLFTIRNGIPGTDGKPYAEKIMVVAESQETPYHYHWNKMEDIINRGGGTLAMELYEADENDGLDTERTIRVQVDGITRSFAPGERLLLGPGESISLPPKLYHRFFGEAGHGDVLTGEVSKVNDDKADNRFLEPLGRFPAIEEDESPLHLLVSDYERYL